MKRRISIVVIILISICSCYSYKQIRDNAKRYESQTLLNNVIEYYSICHYCLPQTPDDLISFLNNWQLYDENGYALYQNDSLKDIKKLFRNNSLKFAKSCDTVYLFSPSEKIGCVAFGSPLYWLKFPENYPFSKSSFHNMFQPAAFSNKDQYVIQYDFSSYNALEEKVYEGFLNSIMCYTPEGYVPFFVVFRYNKKNGKCEIISPIPHHSSLFLVNKKDKSIVELKVESISELINICNEYIEQFSVDIDSLYNCKKTDKITYYLLPARLCL